MILLNAPYAEVSFDKENELGIITWKGKCTSEEYQDAFKRLLELQKTEKITRFISDIRKQAIISPLDRKWFETIALPQAVQQGLKISGVVFDGNAFKKYYINMILAVTNKFGLPTKVFNDKEQAIAFVMGV